MATKRLHVCFAVAFASLHFAPTAWSATPVRLNAPPIQNGDVSLSSLQLSPDGNAVLYLADQDIDGMDEVFVVPIDGGETTKINAPLPSGASATGAHFSPDGERIVYHANQDDLQHIELYSTSLGDSPIKLNYPLPQFGNVDTTLFTANGKVIYVADQDVSTVQEIFAVSVDGGAQVKLNGPMSSTGDAQVISSDFDSDIVIYVANPEFDQRMEVYGASLDGSAHWKLSGPLQTANSSVKANGVRITPGSEHVIYLADANQDEAFELFSVPAVGGDAVPLSPQMVNGGDVLPNPIQVSPLGDQVLYLADQNVDEVFEIFTVPVTGGPSSKVNGALASGGDVREDSLQFNSDGSKVLYIADQTTNEKFELFVAPSQEGSSLRLNSPLVSSGDVTSATFSSNGEDVVYLADVNANDIFELFSVPSSGGESIRLNVGLTSSRDVSSFQITPDGQYVVYLADQEIDERYELFAVPIAGGDVLKLNSDLVNGGDVKSWLISPDSQYIVYRADQEVDEQFEIFSIPLFGTGKLLCWFIV